MPDHPAAGRQATTNPTFFDVARRGRWIGALLACLAVAAVFALLGQWQIERAIEQGQGDDRDTETAVALSSVALPQSQLTTEAGGRMVTVSGEVDPESIVVLHGRGHDSGADVGDWVTARLVTEHGSLAVALGWAATDAEAQAAVQALRDDPPAGELLGRYVISESPTVVDIEQDEHEAMSVPALLNRWPEAARNVDVYAGYLITEAAFGGLDPITNEAPITDTQLNWLNVFYAIEWVVFAGFAFYLWYRMVQDAREREIEQLEEQQGVSA